MKKSDKKNKVKKEVDSDVLNILDKWYQSYQKIVTFIGTASGIVLLYVGLNLIEFISKENEVDNSISVIFSNNQFLIVAGIISLTLSIIFMVFCLITTYNWYVTGLMNILKDKRELEYLETLLDDKMKYRGYWSRMSVWGNISLITGLLTGVFFVLGLVLYSLGIWEVIVELIK